MDIVLYEFRKIFEGKKLLILILFNVVYYFSFLLGMYQTSMPFQHKEGAQVYQELIESYGLTITREELKEFEKTIVGAIEEFNELLRQNEELVDKGITSLEEFEDQLRNEAFYQAHLTDELLSSLRNINWRKNIVEFSNFGEEIYGIEEERERIRINEILLREEQPIFAWDVMMHYRGIITGVAFIIILNLMILIAPIYIKERHCNMLTLQYSTQLGRSIFLKKINATLLATMVLLFFHTAFTFFLYSRTAASLFFPININSGMSQLHMWYDMTFSQFIFLTIGVVFLNGILFALGILCISRLSPNYLTALATQMVIIFFLGYTRYFDFFIADVIRIRFDENWAFNPPYLMPLFYLIFLICMTIILIIQWKREKKIDILN